MRLSGKTKGVLGWSAVTLVMVTVLIWFRDLFTAIGLILIIVGTWHIEKWLPLRLAMAVFVPITAAVILDHAVSSMDYPVILYIPALFLACSLPSFVIGWYWDKARDTRARQALKWVLPVWLALSLVDVAIGYDYWETPKEVAGAFVFLAVMTLTPFFLARTVARRRSQPTEVTQ